MYDYSKIRNMHLEPSSLCNAECPICNRRVSGGPKNPVMIERCITLEEFKQWFPIDFLKQLDQLLLCGNLGDPMTSPYLIDILSYYREVNPTGSISMNTNASGRDNKFWKDLSEIIGKTGRVVFSVDGLEDTNHIYRKGTNWQKITDAMTSFTSTKKSNAIWEFLVFEHNQHQISEARELSNKLGFEEFWPKKAIGFDYSSTEHASIRVLDNDGMLDYKIYAPDDEWKNKAIIKKEIRKDDTEVSDRTTFKLEDVFNYNIDLDKNIETLDKEKIRQLDKCEISCIALHWQETDTQSIFVTSTGLVFPCCFTASKYDACSTLGTVQLRNFVKSYGEDTINLNKVDNIKNIIESDIMQHGYVDRWNKTSIQEGKLYTCGEFCGEDTNIEVISTKESVETKPWKNW